MLRHWLFGPHGEGEHGSLIASGTENAFYDLLDIVTYYILVKFRKIYQRLEI